MAGSRFLLSLLLLFLIQPFLPTGSRAMDLRLIGDWAYTQTNSEIENRADGAVTESESNRFQQTYRLDLSKELFPTLNLNGGAQVEQNRNTTETAGGPETDNRSQQILPYIDFEWRNPLYSLSGGYRERYGQNKGDGINGTEKDYVTSYDMRGEWRPVDFPRLEFNYLHSERYDKPLTSETESDTWLLNSRYEYRDYEFRYSFLRGDDSNRLNQTETTTTTHSGRVRLNRSYLDGRVNLNAGFRSEYTDQEFSGSGSRDFPVSPAGSIFYNPDGQAFPSTDADDYETGISDDLDLNNNAFINVGLDFGDVASVSKLKLGINSEDSLDPGSTIENLSQWAVYSSNDQENWSLQSLQSVVYQQDENLFELTLNATVESEYILVIYTLQLPTNQTGSLRIANLRALISRDLDDGSRLISQVYQAQFGLGWQATEATRASYTFNLQERPGNRFDERRTRLNNGLSVIHHFNDIFTGTGRLSAGHRWDQGKLNNSSYGYSARLSGRYLETLNQSLIYSGTFNQDKDDGDSTTNALILRTNAAMYEGWDLSFDQGTTWQDSDRDGTTSGYFVRLQTSLVPHNSYSLFAEHSINWDDADNGTERSDSSRLRAVWVPRDTLSLAGEVRLRTTREDDQLSWQYSASWLPLRDGSLQCVLTYSEDEDKDGNRTWSFSPGLTWEVTHYANLSFRYTNGEQETNTEINQFETAFLNFKIFYD